MSARRRLRFECCTIHDNWKEDSSGSDQGKNDPDDDIHHETQSVSGNVHFTIGGDSSWGDDLSPIPSIPRRGQKSSMIRSYSHDNNVNTMLIEREKEREPQTASQSKLIQSDSDLGSPVNPQQRHGAFKKLPRDYTFDFDDIRQIRKEDHGLRKSSDDRGPRKLVRDQSEDFTFNYIKGGPESKMKSDSREYLREMDHLEELRKASADDFRKIPSSDSNACGEEIKRVTIQMEESRRHLDDPRRPVRLDDFRKSANSATEDKDETLSTDSNSTAAEDPEAKKKKRKLFGNFRKPKLKS